MKNKTKIALVIMLIACAYVIFQMTVLGDSSKVQVKSNLTEAPSPTVTSSTYTPGDAKEPSEPSTPQKDSEKNKEGSKVQPPHSKEDKSDKKKPTDKSDQQKQSDKPKQPEEVKQPNKATKPLVGKIAYITFDDGASPHTMGLLDVLKEYDVEATFFMLEPNMRRYPEAVKRLVKEGHMPAMHGVTHQVKKYYASRTSVVSEMTAGQKTIQKLTGAETWLIRTPYGSAPYMKKDYMKAVKDAGFTLWDWNVDSLDWKYRDARYVDTVKKEVLGLEKKNISPVILMHDRKETLKYLPQVLKFLKDRGYQFKTLDETLKPIQFSKG